MLLSTASSARDIFVDNIAGDDRRDGSTERVSGRAGGPVRSLRRALALASGSDRVVLQDTGEPYRESVTLQAGKHTGVPTRPFTIVGNGATLDGSAPVPQDAWKHVDGNTFRFRPSRTSFQILFIDGKPLVRRFVQRELGFPKLQPLEWCLFDRDVYFCVEKDKLPGHYDLSHTALPVGITLYEARNIVITDLVIQGFQLDGLNAHDSVFDATLVGLTCRGNGRSGISVGGASRVKIIACLVGNNGVAQVRTEGFSRTEILNSDLVEAENAPAVVRDGGLVSVTADDAPGS
ncbi:MAG: right-handed parallel beta-helix repeat-containing protein [Planctomycetes bacterium]|nr:right-handed parallel beta-helix repeat-containing protein [Planctomycetota bacterium]